MVGLIISTVILGLATIVLAILFVAYRNGLKSMTQAYYATADDRDRCADFILNNYIMQSNTFKAKKHGVQKMDDAKRAEAKKLYDEIKAKQVKKDASGD